jgi:DNA-directed RNA polymerase subunit RPC12/RpoP
MRLPDYIIKGMDTMKKVLSILLVLSVLTAFTASYALAQSTQELQLGLSRDFGYGGFGNDIQGLFTVKINNPPANLTSVEFYIDSTLMGTDTTAPFNLQFNTDSYPLGAHTLSAIGYTSDGAELKSNQIQSQFVPAGTGLQSVTKIILPVLGLILLIALISVFLPIILSRGKSASTPLGTERKYGVGGGAICPKCNRPFPLRLWWINLGVNKIDRCPYCGKWSFVRPRSLAELRQAEAAELSGVKSEIPMGVESEADKLKRELDDSRFHDA